MSLKHVNESHKLSYAKQGTASALLLGGKQKTVMVCTYCRQPDASENCQVFNTVQARKEVLKRNGNCFVCLRKGHHYRDCHSGAKCRECKGHHHSSICNELEEKKESKLLDARSEPFIPQNEAKGNSVPQAVSSQPQAWCRLTASDKTAPMQTI